MSEQYFCTVYEMEERFGPSPRVGEACPICEAEPHQPHADDCPWLLWARSPVPSSVPSSCENGTA